jgi:energy-coupling factor transport system ATP-binding protein
MLDVKDLRVRYGNRSRPAVDGMSFSVSEGEFVLLCGDSASGKSTAMQAVCGFIPHIIPAEVSGTIHVGGRVHDDPTEVARIACMVQQDPETQFCTETVEEEVAFGPENFNLPPAVIRFRVDQALASVHADHLIDRRLSTLSGGEKQKVAIASMLALEPKMLILDEPTSSLDPRSVSEVVSAIAQLKKTTGITVIVVEHRLAGFLDMATRVLLMEDGKLVRDTRPEQLEFTSIHETASAIPQYPRPTRRKGEVLSAVGLGHDIDGKTILDGLSFTIEEGAVVALMGENGAGKTTLLRHLIGLATPTRGTLRVLGHEISSDQATDPWVMGKDVGLVFQNPNHQIFEDTVEREMRFASENYAITMGPADAAIEDFVKTEGVSRNVHPHCLSFGQKRRVNISSASAHGPRLLLLDEPFAGQDSGNALRISQQLHRLQTDGRTLVIVTHDPQFARAFCTDVVLLRQGRLAAVGAADKVLSEHGDIFAKEGP